MTKVKRIVCLADSRKLSGRCIAGREIKKGRAGNWIRPVSDRKNREISEYERQYEDGSDPNVHDIIDISVKNRQTKGCQTENWLIDPEYYWKRVGSVSANELSMLTDSEDALWLDGFSTVHGRNDQIPIETASALDSSLRLLRVEELELKVFRPSVAFGNSKRRVQAQFVHAGQEYAFWITDPVYETKYLAKENGSYRIGDCYLTIRLGEPYRNAIYKLVAAIIENTRR